MNENFRVRTDQSTGQLGLYKSIASDVPGAAQGWEKIASEEDFRAIHFALKYSEIHATDPAYPAR